MSESKPPATEGRYLTADGPITLAELNPRAVLRFQDRVCETCEQPIMSHFIRRGSDEYWCSRDGDQFSAGLKV